MIAHIFSILVFTLFVNQFECKFSTNNPQWFNKIFVMMFENTGIERTLRSSDFANFALKGRLYTQYFAAYHPSQPNYWSHSAATNFGMFDNNAHERDDICIADLLEDNHVSWKTYQEDYPGGCRKDLTIGNYARRHNPFISFKSICNNATRCAKIVNSGELDSDLDAGKLPQYSFYTPNVRNDGHDTGIDFGGRYLTEFFRTRLSKFPPKTLIVITFDEDDMRENNRIYTLLIGDMITPNTKDNTSHTCFSLTRTIEDNWGLGDMGRNDKTAIPLLAPKVITPTLPPSNNIKPGKWFDRIFIYQFENTGYVRTMRNQDFANLATRGRLYTNYFAVYHPSQPNYLAAAAATNYGWYSNGAKNFTEKCIAETFEDHFISWKTYQEDYPGNCFHGDNYFPNGNGNIRYVRKHNPFISFVGIHSNATRCAKIVNSDELDKDLDAGTLPQYSFFTPNMNNDAHDTDINYAGNYLTSFLPQRLPKFPPRTLIVVTFDEDFYDENNHIYTLFIGDMITPNTRDDTRVDTFSLVRTVQDNWNLPTLGNEDSKATSIFKNEPTLAPTNAATTVAPTTAAPTTAAPTTAAPTTAAPTTAAPTTAAPTTAAPTTAAPTTAAPTTAAPTLEPTTAAPTTAAPTTAAPTVEPTTAAPTTTTPTIAPTTVAPTTAAPTVETSSPTAAIPTNIPTFSISPTSGGELEGSNMNKYIIIASIVAGGFVVIIVIAIIVLKMLGIVDISQIGSGLHSPITDQSIQLGDPWGEENLDLDNSSDSNNIDLTSSSDSGFGDD